MSKKSLSSFHFIYHIHTDECGYEITHSNQLLFQYLLKYQENTIPTLLSYANHPNSGVT